MTAAYAVAEPVSAITVAEPQASAGCATLGYARVSTDGQDLTLQMDALRLAGCWRVFTDKASGTLTDRPALGAVLDHLRPGDTLVVWRLDRLGRSLQHLLVVVADLESRKIGFRSLHESVDTTTPSGRLVFHVFAAIAEFERDLIRERTLAGLAAARAQGRLGGRPSVMNPERVQAARAMLAAGQNVAAVARSLKVSRATVYRHIALPDATSEVPPLVGAR